MIYRRRHLMMTAAALGLAARTGFAAGLSGRLRDLDSDEFQALIQFIYEQADPFAPPLIDTEEALKADGIDPGMARWQQEDGDLVTPAWPIFAESPDTAHLGRDTSPSVQFELSGADLRRFAEANAFSLEGPFRVLLGLRGCRLANGDGYVERAERVALQLVNPDHQRFNCLIGIWWLRDDRISLYRASTVPHALFTLEFDRHGGDGCNLLPTGLHHFDLGCHRCGSAGELPRVPVQRAGGYPSVLRSKSNAQGYVLPKGTEDIVRWERRIGVPGDNIHCSYNRQGFAFASAGGQVVHGDFTGGSHQGLWGLFYQASGLGQAGRGAVYEYILAGAAELSVLANDEDFAAGYKALRFGSQGAAVAALQRQLMNAPSHEQTRAWYETTFERELTNRRFVDGLFGRTTQMALIFEQAAAGMLASGLTLLPRAS
ncbi:MAG: hypothetical protein ACFB6S_03000 [Geminicoccaceae bacterium]